MIYDATILPSGWEWKKLKFCASYNDESLSETTDPLLEFRYIEISDVSLSSGVLGTTNTTFGEAPSRARRVVRKGDVIVSTVRTYLKAIATIEEDADDLIASTGFCVIRAKDVDPGYLSWTLKSDIFVDEVVSQSVGVSYPAINASALMNIKIPVPPEPVQRNIDEYLTERAGRIDRLSSRPPAGSRDDALFRLHRSISDYRTSLIFHAVSGQIDGLQ